MSVYNCLLVLRSASGHDPPEMLACAFMQSCGMLVCVPSSPDVHQTDVLSVQYVRHCITYSRRFQAALGHEGVGGGCWRRCPFQWRRNRGSGGSKNRGPELLGPRVVGPQKIFRQDS